MASWQGAAVHAAPVTGVRPAMTQPVCPRGSVLMMPLTSDKPGDHWPQSIELTLSDGRTIVGYVAWIDRVESQFERHWTDDPRGIRIRTVLRDDNNLAVNLVGGLGPYLLAQLPLDGAGQMRMGELVLQPFWVDVPDLPSLRLTEDVAMASDRPRMHLTPTPDRPDPVSPFEYWRWVLQADRLEMLPPHPFGGDVERMAAEHFAALWRVGLTRLSTLSPRVANECLMLLTKTAIDQRQPFAVWVTDPVQISTLLSSLVDFSRPDAEALTAAATWVQQQLPLVVWPEAEHIEHVELAMFTSGSDAIAATLHWQGSADPPVAVQIEPGLFMRVNVERPPRPKPEVIGLPPPPEPDVSVLEVQVRGKIYEVTFGRRAIRAKPPGVFFRALAPPLTLHEAQTNRRWPATEDFATHAHVRRLSGRWEVFFECLRPAQGGAAVNESAALPEEITGLEALRGIEAATVMLGLPDDPQQPQVWLTVPESGFWKVVRGVNDGTLQVHRRSYEDRWLCRIVLPETWFSAQASPQASIGVARSHGDTLQIETGPNICTPWRPHVGRAILDLSRWDDLPGMSEPAR
jgi:hypothetical protein